MRKAHTKKNQEQRSQQREHEKGKQTLSNFRLFALGSNEEAAEELEDMVRERKKYG
jgi:hypothetical protein